MSQPSTERDPKKTLQKVDIFISYPSDVKEEQQIALRVVQRLNKLHHISERYLLKPLAHEDSVPAVVGESPQTTVNTYMMQAGKSDIFICILGHRMGTPVIDEMTGERFQSGTEYEFLDAYQSYQKTRKPHMLLYRSVKPFPPHGDAEQLQRVQDFFNRFYGEDAELKGYIKTYDDNKEFEDMLFHDLETVISRNLIGPHDSRTSAAVALEPTRNDHHREELVEAPSISQFYGREKELAALGQWIMDDHCRLVALLGIGGIGKTALAATLIKQIKERFEYVFWRELKNAPPLASILKSCIEFVSNQEQINLPKELNDQISLLLQYLQNHRCLLILDNCETILQGGKRTGQYREGYEEYGKLIRRLGEAEHSSCLLLTSREKPNELTLLEKKTSPVRSLSLTGLELTEAKELLSDEDLFGADETWADLVSLYAGNPLALKLVCEPIRELYGSDIAPFLRRGEVITGNIYDLLDDQFARLSALEQEIMYWLAIEREAVSLNVLEQDIARALPRGALQDALTSLRRRYMIERTETGSFTLQQVIMEFVTDSLVERMWEEIDTGIITLFGSHALIKAQAKDYVRSSQVRVILEPLAKNLLSASNKGAIEKKLKSTLSILQTKHPPLANYAAGNILNLLVHLGVKLRGYDFSYLPVWQAYLEGVALPDVNFAHAHFVSPVFTDTFGSLLYVAFSPDGKTVASGTVNYEIRLWQVPSGTPLGSFKGHTDWIRSFAFSPDGTILASGSDDRKIRLWEVDTERCLKVIEGHTKWVCSIAFSPDGKMIASGSDDQTVRFWEVSTGRCLNVLQEHTDRVRSVAFSPDRRLLASGSDDQTIRLWDMSTMKCIRILQGHTNEVRSIAFSPDGSALASGSSDKTVRLWEVSTGHSLKVLHGHTDEVRSVAFSPDGKMVASSGEDQHIRLWDVSTGQYVHILQGHTNPVRSVAFQPNGNILASGSEDQTVRLWEVSTGHSLKVLRGLSNRVWSVAFSRDGSLLASGSEDNAVRIWDVEQGKCLKTLHGHGNWVFSVVFSPDGSVLASSSSDSNLHIWEVSTGRRQNTLHPPDCIWSIDISPDGTTLVTGSFDQTVRLWNLRTGDCQILEGHVDHIRSVAYSVDGSVIVSGGVDQTIRLWEANTGRCFKTLSDVNEVYAVAFSPNGEVVASGGDDRAVRLWHALTGECFSVLPGHAQRIRSIAFSPDGKIVASGSEDGSVRLWDVRTGQCLHILEGHSGQVWSVDFSPNGKLLATGSNDGTITLWDVQAGTRVKTLGIERLYERMDITNVQGLTDAQIDTLKALGARHA